MKATARDVLIGISAVLFSVGIVGGIAALNPAAMSWPVALLGGVFIALVAYVCFKEPNEGA